MESADGWLARYSRFEVYYAVVLAATIGFTVAGASSVVALDGALVALGLLTAWYVGYGRRLIRRPDGREDWRHHLYLAVAFALFASAVALVGSASFVIYAIGPQAYMLVRPLPATVAVVLLDAVPVLRFLAETGDLSRTLTESLPMAALMVFIAAAFGTWARNLVIQSDERAELIHQLERSRGEAARLSHEAGVLAERQRLAGDIHDTIAQGLSSVVLLIQAADAEIERDPARARHHLDLAAQTARENLTETRSLVAALTPAALDGSSLVEAVDRLTRRFGQETGIAVTFTANPPSHPLPTPVEVVLLRAAQESLTNVRKHADARSASVRIEHARDIVVLEVRDDGSGRAAPEPGGYGLPAMRARVEQVRGQLSVCSAANEGYTVRVEVPY